MAYRTSPSRCAALLQTAAALLFALLAMAAAAAPPRGFARLDTLDTPGSVEGIALAGGRAYLADAASGLRIVDVADPTDLVELGSLDTPGSTNDVEVAGTRAYLADGAGGLRIVNVSMPSTPVELGSLSAASLGGDARAVEVVGGRAYLAVGTAGIVVVDVSVPSSPVVVGSLDTPGTAVDLQVEDGIAYVADSAAGLRVVDVSSPPSLVEIGSLDTPGTAVELQLAGGVAYVADGALRSIDVSTPSAPVERDALGSSTASLAIDGSFAWIGSGASLVLVDVSDSSALVERARSAVSPSGTSASVRGVVVAGDVAWVAEGTAGLVSVDVADPLPVSGSADHSQFVNRTEVVGNLAYVVSEVDLKIFDVSSPTAAVELGALLLPGVPRDVKVEGNVAYVAAWSAGLLAIDVSDASVPTLIGSLDTPGFANALDVVGSLAYVADGTAGLQVVDVTNPAAPTLLGGIDTPDLARDVQVVGTLAYVADDNSGGLRLIDVSNPSAPFEVSSIVIDSLANAQRVEVVGSFAYVAAGLWGLQIVGVANPSAPYLHRRLEATGGGGFAGSETFLDVAIGGHYAYVATSQFGGTVPGDVGDFAFRVVDLSDLSNPVPVVVGTLPGGTGNVELAGSLAYVSRDVTQDTRGLRVVDVSNPASPVDIAGVGLLGDDARRVEIVGNLAYLADGTSGLRILDVSDPAHPADVATYDTPGLALDVDVVGPFAYVADDTAGLRIIDVSDPTAPFESGWIDPGGSATDVEVVGSLAYLAQSDLRIIDVSNPGAPSLVGDFDLPSLVDALSVAVSGSTAYVGLDDNVGLKIVNVSDPAHPAGVATLGPMSGVVLDVQVVGNTAYLASSNLGLVIIDLMNLFLPFVSLKTPGHPQQIQVLGPLAYVAADSGVRIVDVSDPSDPSEVGSLQTSDGPFGIQVVGSLAYVAADDAGLQVFSFEPCADGIDNDGDGLADAGGDPECSDAADLSESADCGDLIDNDRDGVRDAPDDPGCSSAADTSEHTPLFACDDGVDNDFDGEIDAADPGCPMPMAGPEDPACDDGVDNDNDGFTDFADPQCSPENPYRERKKVCGLGYETALLLMLWRVRSGSRSGRAPRDAPRAVKRYLRLLHRPRCSRSATGGSPKEGLRSFGFRAHSCPTSRTS